jgi:hypothetical protein
MKKIEGSYIQYAEGYDKDEVTSIDIEKALNDLISMDDEHGAFWISVYESKGDELILELHKNLILIGNFGKDKIYKIQLQSLDSSRLYFDLFLKGMIDELIEKLKNN